MKKYLIERNVSNAGRLTQEELQLIARTSCKAIAELREPYHWIETFVTGDKLYCIHVAENEESIRRHAALGGFPVDKVTEVRTIIDATTAG